MSAELTLEDSYSDETPEIAEVETKGAEVEVETEVVSLGFLPPCEVDRVLVQIVGNTR